MRETICAHKDMDVYCTVPTYLPKYSVHQMYVKPVCNQKHTRVPRYSDRTLAFLGD